MTDRVTTVDFVARGNSPNEWRLVLVEQGPWTNSLEANLSRLQDRLYGCIDAALDGQVAEKFPESRGSRITIQLDCYNLPREPIDEFFEEFASGVFSIPDYRNALNNSPFVNQIGFEITFDSIH
jgi:hypothetical protein